MVTVLIFRIPYVKKAYLDDLIVDEAFRGHGLGSKLLQKAISLAKEKDAAYVDFTSRPRRIAGNTLYEKLGFKKRDTNVYRLILSYEEV
jgi:ribosomal protein S18 acetylase RimI-like enzyme